MTTDKQFLPELTQNFQKAQIPQAKPPLIQWFYDLPIARKQFIAILGSPLLTLGVVFVAQNVIVNNAINSLASQAETQNTVTEINYSIKVNQMGFGFRGQSDNSAIINAAKLYSEGKPLTPEQRSQVLRILKNEITARQIEYATLVGKDAKIIVNANTNRTGEVFNPNGLVGEVLGKDNRQIKANTLVTWSELKKENPPLPKGFANQDALIRYTVTPVNDPITQKPIAALISGDIINGKFVIPKLTIKQFRGGYSAIYQRNAKGDFTVASSLDQGTAASVDKAQQNIALPSKELLDQAVTNPGTQATSRLKIGSQNYTLAAITIPNLARQELTGPVPVDSKDQPVAVLVRGAPETSLEQINEVTNTLVMVVIGLVALLTFFLLILFRETISRRLIDLQGLTKQFAEGDRQVRAMPLANDEIGQLETTFNQLAETIVSSETVLAQEADRQRQEKETLQYELINLLSEVEGAASGDLTVRASLTAGEIGIIGDFFNAIIESLREVVTQVKDTANQVNSSVGANETSVRNLSAIALTQSEQVMETLHSVEAMTTSMQEVAKNANQAAAVSRTAADKAEAGGSAMELSVANILKLRETVAETAKKVKRLGEASQQISKVVVLINQIALKTNLLAVNASIEAAKAGEEGRGFAVVAEEVGALASQSADATKEIERIVENIQQETSEVVEAMEEGTSQVVEGTRLVEDARESLRQIVDVSRTVNDLFQQISLSTTHQSETSQSLQVLMEQIAEISKQTSTSSLEISSSLQETVGIAQQLQSSVKTFKVEV